MENNTRFLNHQERQIMDEIKKINTSLKKDDVLMRRLNKDFKREIHRDLDQQVSP
jgi:hypothetical protein